MQRAAAAADFGNGVSWVLPFDDWIFLNPRPHAAPGPRAAGRVDRPRRPHPAQRPGHGHGRVGPSTTSRAASAGCAEPPAAAATGDRAPQRAIRRRDRPGDPRATTTWRPCTRPWRRSCPSASASWPGACGGRGPRSPTAPAGWPRCWPVPASACGPTLPTLVGWRRGNRPRPRGPLPPQRPRVPRGHARRLEGSGRRRQRQLPLRRHRAALRAGRQRGPRGDLPRRVRRHPGRGAARPPARRAAAPGRRRLGRRPAAGGGALRGRPGLRPPARPAGLSPDDRYILYTGGTTGMPKGTLWRQGDFLATALGVTAPLGRDRRGRPARPGCGPCPRRRSCTAPPTGTPSRPGPRAAP